MTPTCANQKSSGSLATSSTFFIPVAAAFADASSLSPFKWRSAALM